MGSGQTGFHHFPEFAKSHVHCVGDAVQPSHPLSPPSPPVLNFSKDQDNKYVFW